MKLTFAAKWQQDFSDPAELASFKIADLACGTGTLLMASAQAISDAYIRERADIGLPLGVKDMSTLHRALMENVLHGYDVLPSAVHLTASTLAMLAPEVAFVRMGLFVMPLGMDHSTAKLGSLDFLNTNEVETQMQLDYSHTEAIRAGASSSDAVRATVPPLDLCVMNPPFVRSVGGNLLFGSLPDERGRLQTELKRRVREIGASATAGLGSIFVALADRWLKPDGRLAFVLPAALASGEAWGDTRKLIAEKYHLETVISSHDAERPNFSENTDLSEILFIARKRAGDEPGARTKYISLWRNPRSIHEALDLANRISHADEPVTVEGAGLTTISGLSGKLGEMVSLPAATENENWTGALFAQCELLRVCWRLQKGELTLPGASDRFTLPMCPLDSLGGLGYDRRDIHDAFEVSREDWSPYPAFWGNESDKVLTISQKSNACLLARTEAAKGRHLKSATDVWSKAGRILIVERLRSNTHRLIATGFEKEVLGNTWWALKPHDLDSQQQKALLLWLNGSLSVLLFFGRRVVTEGAWMQMKKPAWASMPVLNVRTLSSKQLVKLADSYDGLSTQQLDPISHLNSDATRLQIDETISTVLGIPEIAFVRELLVREPGLSAKDIAPREGGSSFEKEEDEDDDQASLSIDSDE